MRAQSRDGISGRHHSRPGRKRTVGLLEIESHDTNYYMIYEDYFSFTFIYLQTIHVFIYDAYEIQIYLC